MEIEFKQQEEIGIITPPGRLDVSSAQDLKDEFDRFLKKTSYFVFDLANVEFMDSTGLGAIISCMKKTSQANGDIYIANLQSKPQILFEITKAYKIFEVFDDLDTAVNELKQQI